MGEEAFMQASRWEVWDVASAAATGLVHTVGVGRARYREARTWAEHARVAQTHAGDPTGLREAARLEQLSAVDYADGELERARAQ